MKYAYSLSFYTKLTKFYGMLAFCSILVAALYSTSLFRTPMHSATGIKVAPASRAQQANTNASSIADAVTLKVANGDTLLSLMEDAKVAKADALSAVKALSPYHDLGGLSIGQKISLTFDVHDSAHIEDAPIAALPLRSLVIQVAPEKELQLLRTTAGNFKVIEKAIPLTRHVTRVSGSIDNSLLATANSLGIPSSVMMDLIKAYSYDVDFERDIQQGDKFEVLFERFYDQKGEFARDGNIIFSSLILGNRQLNIYRHTLTNGDTGYYTADGHSVRKDLLRTPLNVVHITSSFGMRRHPVLGYSKMHRGVDFAASTGTPIFAAGSGIIEEIGRKSTYGNYVRIRHSSQYSTAYAHASRLANLRKGDSVKQGDVIAYVGSTGRATGPHLHYEVMMNNQQVDPLSIKVSPGIKLAGAEWERFSRYKQNIKEALLKAPAQGEVALNFNSNAKQATN